MYLAHYSRFKIKYFIYHLLRYKGIGSLSHIEIITTLSCMKYDRNYTDFLKIVFITQNCAKIISLFLFDYCGHHTTKEHIVG